MLADTKIKNHTCGLIVALLTPFLLTILLVVEVIYFYILKFSLLLQFQIKKYCEYWYKQNLRDTYKLVLVVWQVQARVTMH